MLFGIFSSSSSSDSSGGSDGDDFEDLQKLLEAMIRSLVDQPEDVQLQMIPNPDGGVSFELRVSKNDLGKVIGKKGRTASAMRTILSAASRKHRFNADLRIVE